MRKLPLSIRKANLARLLARRRMASSLPHSSRARSALICSGTRAGWGLRGWYQSIATEPYRAGRSSHWIKVKNPASPAMMRAQDVDWSSGNRGTNQRRRA